MSGLMYPQLFFATPKPSQSSKFSLEGFIISFRATAAPPRHHRATVPLQPGALKQRALKPGASKPARDFTFGIQERPKLLDMTPRPRAYALGLKP